MKTQIVMALMAFAFIGHSAEANVNSKKKVETSRTSQIVQQAAYRQDPDPNMRRTKSADKVCPLTNSGVSRMAASNPPQAQEKAPAKNAKQVR